MSRVIFFFNDTATTEIYTLSLHDALPICDLLLAAADVGPSDPPVDPALGGALLPADVLHLAVDVQLGGVGHRPLGVDRKSTRLNSSHANISYAVFCLKKKKIDEHRTHLSN